MKYKTILFTAFVSLLGSTSLKAQILNGLGNRIGERVEETASQRTEDEAAEKTDNALDKVFDSKWGKRKKKGKDVESSEEETEASSNTSAEESAPEEAENADESNASGSFLFGNSDVTTEDSYSFEFTATMHVENYEKKKTQEHNMQQSYGGSSLLSVTEEGQKIIHDLENEAAILLDDDKKIAQVVSLNAFKKMMGGNKPDEDETPATVEKTGKTKTMHGYTCHEYIITSDAIRMEAWYAPDVEFDVEDYLSGFAKMFGKKAGPMSTDNGYVMEMTMYEEGEKMSYMVVTDFEVAPITVNMSNYTVQKMF